MTVTETKFKPIRIIKQLKENSVENIKLIDELIKRINTLEKQVEENCKIKKLRVATKDAVYYINYQDILYLKSSSNYTHIHLVENTNILVSKTLKNLSGKIKNPAFMRIHTAVLVNTRYLSQYLKKKSKVILDNGVELPVSRIYKKALIHWLDEQG